MITMKITSWEKERRPHSYWWKPQPHGGTTPASWRDEEKTMEMNPGALPCPDRVPAQEFWSPELVDDGGGDRNCLWRKGFWNQGFHDGSINKRQRGHRGWSQSPRR